MQDEHCASSHVDRRERTIEEIERLLASDGHRLRRFDRLSILRDASVGIDGMTATVTTRIGGDAQHDLEEPRARPVTAVDELLPATVSDDEHLLALVLDVAVHHAESAEVPPHEGDVGVVDEPELPLALGMAT